MQRTQWRNSIKEMVNYICLPTVGTITGAIVSVYRWALEEIGVLEKIYFQI